MAEPKTAALPLGDAPKNFNKIYKDKNLLPSSLVVILWAPNKFVANYLLFKTKDMETLEFSRLF